MTQNRRNKKSFVLKEAHTSIDQWEERIVTDLNARFELDSQKNQILQEQMTSRDYQLRKCGDFLSRIIQGMVTDLPLNFSF